MLEIKNTLCFTFCSELFVTQIITIHLTKMLYFIWEVKYYNQLTFKKNNEYKKKNIPLIQERAKVLKYVTRKVPYNFRRTFLVNTHTHCLTLVTCLKG